MGQKPRGNPRERQEAGRGVGRSGGRGRLEGWVKTRGRRGREPGEKRGGGWGSGAQSLVAQALGELGLPVGRGGRL